MMYVMVCQLNEKWPVGMSRDVKARVSSWHILAVCTALIFLTWLCGGGRFSHSIVDLTTSPNSQFLVFCSVYFNSPSMVWLKPFQPRQALASQMPEPSGLRVSKRPAMDLKHANEMCHSRGMTCYVPHSLWVCCFICSSCSIWRLEQCKDIV